jgi:hypothetical protein
VNATNTESEAAFETFCARNGFELLPVPVGSRKSPDHALTTNGTMIVVGSERSIADGRRNRIGTTGRRTCPERTRRCFRCSNRHAAVPLDSTLIKSPEVLNFAPCALFRSARPNGSNHVTDGVCEKRANLTCPL